MTQPYEYALLAASAYDDLRPTRSTPKPPMTSPALSISSEERPLSPADFTRASATPPRGPQAGLVCGLPA
jgi:hypothetical protein